MKTLVFGGAGQGGQDLRENLLGPLPQILGPEVGNGVRNGDNRISRRPEISGVLPGRILKKLGHDGCGDHPPLLQLDGVEHTARRTGASPANRCDHQLAPLRQLIDQLGRSTLCVIAFPVPDHLVKLKTLGEQLFDHR